MKLLFDFAYPPAVVIPLQDSKEVTFELIRGGQIEESKIYSQNCKKISPGDWGPGRIK